MTADPALLANPLASQPPRQTTGEGGAFGRTGFAWAIFEWARNPYYILIVIYIFAPSGRVLETHPLPVDEPTNCTFGDADLSSLYITTLDGHLLRARNTGRRGWHLWPPAG